MCGIANRRAPVIRRLPTQRIGWGPLSLVWTTSPSRRSSMRMTPSGVRIRVPGVKQITPLAPSVLPPWGAVARVW